jgi:Xaa-Pro dipeptidase
MNFKRRDFINLSATIAGTGLLAGFNACTPKEERADKKSLPGSLESMTTDIVPVTLGEREARIKKAQGLMADQKMEAMPAPPLNILPVSGGGPAKG